MNITKVSVFPVEGRASTRAIVTVVFDNAIVLHGLSVIQRKDGGLFVTMASRKNEETGRYEDIYYHPITVEARRELCDVILACYAKAKEHPDHRDFDMGDPDKAPSFTSIRFRESSGKSLKVACAVLDDGMLLNNIAIFKSADTDELYLRMPSRKTGTGDDKKDVYHPITAEGRKALTDAVLNAYRAECEKPAEG